MNQNENMDAEITLTEENESSTAMYDLSPEDFAALTATATELELQLGQTLEADTCVHCAERTEHWFKLIVLHEADYSFSANVCVGARLYDAQGNLLAADNDDGEKNGFLVNYTLTQGQVYYLRVMPKLNYFMRFNTAINGTYHSPYEESMATAQEIYLEVKANGYFSTSQREQWYKFTVPENGQYTINATGDMNTIGALYDNFGYLITEQNGYTPAGSSNFRIRRYLTANTTYYVQVREANEKSGPFKLLVTEKQLIDSISITPSTLVFNKVGAVYELPTRPNTFLNVEGTKALNDISLTVTPGTVENKRVLWSSLTGNVISIDYGWSNGERYYTMTIVGEGTAKLIATDPDGNGKRGECTVYVNGSQTASYHAVLSEDGDEYTFTCASSQCNDSFTVPKDQVVGSYVTSDTDPRLGNSQIPLACGIDVSYQQGEISQSQWNEIADTRIDGHPITFAILRIGIDLADEDDIIIGREKDEQFENNYVRAKAAGLHVGCYYYTKSLSTQCAIVAAEHVIKWIGNKQLEYPVFFDIESGRILENVPNKSTRSEICTSFMDKMREAGFFAGLYTNNDWIKTKLDSSTLLPEYDFWYARYKIGVTKPNFWGWNGESDWAGVGRKFGMWQYTKEKHIPPISGNVDCDVAYKNYPLIIKSLHLNNF